MRDVAQPFCRGRKVWLGGAQEHWVSFKFERLPTFCYWCGKVNHGDRDCALWLASRGTLSPATQQYCPWLHAETECFFNRPFQRFDSWTSPSKEARTPQMSTGHSGKRTPGKVDGLTAKNITGPVQASPNITSVKPGVTHRLTFTE